MIFSIYSDACALSMMVMCISIFSLQILHIVKFIRKFIDDNPLCVCSEEISNLKKLLQKNDEIKLKQKTSQVVLKLKEGQYFMNVKLTVPNDYPNETTK